MLKNAVVTAGDGNSCVHSGDGGVIGVSKVNKLHGLNSTNVLNFSKMYLLVPFTDVLTFS